MTDTTAVTPGPTPAPAPARPRRRGLLFPLVLIVLGGLFFAANFGYIAPISARAVLSLWPLILVLVGIEMIVARRQPYLALALELLVLAAGVAAVLVQPLGLIGIPANASTDAVVERQGTRTMSLRVDGGGGSYSITGGAAGSLLAATSRGGEIEVATRRTGDSADIRIRPLDRVGGPFFGGSAPSNVDVRIAPDVPTSLRVSVGAGDFNVDLHDLQIRDARVETGASNLTVTLPRPSGDVSVILQAGAASITVVVPEGVEARVTTTGGLVSSSTQNTRFGSASGSVLGRGGSSVETSGYAAAKDRVTVSIEAGASSITIR